MPLYQGNRFFATFGRRPRQKMGREERATKKRMNNTDLWRQLDAAATGSYVNHLGPRHRRRPADIEEGEWSARVQNQQKAS